MDKSRGGTPRPEDRVAAVVACYGVQAHGNPRRRLSGLRPFIRSAICLMSDRLSCGASASRKGRTNGSGANMPSQGGTLRMFTKVDHQAIGANRIRNADPAICKTKKTHHAAVTRRV